MIKSHLDDLPSRTPEHVGETESRNAFKRIFGDPFFIERHQAINDYGIDVTVEALRDATHPTNICAHVQLKSSTKDPNANGSYSYPVDRTNLNYLLNAPGSIYVFYSRGERRLFYRWAVDVFREYEQQGDAWHSQASVTVRFSDELDADAV